MTDSDTSFSEVLENAAELMRSLASKAGSLRASEIALVLDELAQLDVSKSSNIPMELAEKLPPAVTDDPRSGATFVRRPGWLGGPDRFPLTASFDEDNGGWSTPDEADAPVVAAIQGFLRRYGQRQEEGEEASKHDEALSAKLSDIDLSQEQLTLARPQFLSAVTFAHIELDLGAELGLLDGFFHIAKTDDGSLDVDSFDFGSSGIHLLNAKYGARIAGNELPYLRYFMHITRASEGAFRVIDRQLLDRLRGLFEEGSEAAEAFQKSILDIWHPPILTGVRHDGGLIYDAFVLYGGGIFKATLSLRSNGMIDMIDDDVLMAPRADLREA